MGEHDFYGPTGLGELPFNQSGLDADRNTKIGRDPGLDGRHGRWRAGDDEVDISPAGYLETG